MRKADPRRAYVCNLAFVGSEVCYASCAEDQGDDGSFFHLVHTEAPNTDKLRRGGSFLVDSPRQIHFPNLGARRCGSQYNC
jgi:hypothetical protein